MGIHGLLKALDSFAEVCHVDQFPGKRAGIDASSWLHKGAFGCARELALKLSTRNQLGQLRYVEYCMRKARMLKFNKVSPVLVFDGCATPMKKEENEKRKRGRKENMQKALSLNRSNKIEESEVYFQRAVSVTFEMAHELMKAARAGGFEVVVAPYEADAQLAYMAREGAIDIVITEDSDLLAFGAPLVLYKMGDFGEGKMIRLDHVIGSRSDDADLRKIDDELKFTQLCIMCGCDYLENIPGLGFKTILGLFQKHTQFDRIMRILKHNSTGRRKQVKLPTDYIVDFERTLTAFRHQTVFCHQQLCTKPLRPIPAELKLAGEQLAQCVGPHFSPDEATKICKLGQLNPQTRLPFSPAPVAPAKLLTESQAEAPKRSKGGAQLSRGQTKLKFDVRTSLPKGIAKATWTSTSSLRSDFRIPKKLIPNSVEIKKQKREKLAVDDEMMMNMYGDNAVTTVLEEAKQDTPSLGSFPAVFDKTPMCRVPTLNPFKFTAKNNSASLSLPSAPSLQSCKRSLDPTTAPRDKKRRVESTPSPVKVDCRMSPRLQRQQCTVVDEECKVAAGGRGDCANLPVVCMQWSCSHCTYLNHCELSSCEACGASSQPKREVPLPKPRKIGLVKPRPKFSEIKRKSAKCAKDKNQMTLTFCANSKT